MEDHIAVGSSKFIFTFSSFPTWVTVLLSFPPQHFFPGSRVLRSEFRKAPEACRVWLSVPFPLCVQLSDTVACLDPWLSSQAACSFLPQSSWLEQVWVTQMWWESCKLHSCPSNCGFLLTNYRGSSRYEDVWLLWWLVLNVNLTNLKSPGRWAPQLVCRRLSCCFKMGRPIYCRWHHPLSWEILDCIRLEKVSWAPPCVHCLLQTQCDEALWAPGALTSPLWWIVTRNWELN